MTKYFDRTDHLPACEMVYQHLTLCLIIFLCQVIVLIFVYVMLVNVNRHQKCQELFFLLPQVCKEKNSRKDSYTQCQGGSLKFLQSWRTNGKADVGGNQPIQSHIEV
jgi:hypothetical protein